MGGGAIPFGLLAILWFAVLAFGGPHGWATAIVVGATTLLGLAWFVSARRPAGVSRSIVLTGTVLAGYLFLQVVPLPASFVGLLSPQTAALLGEVGEVLALDPGERAGGEPEGARARVASLAAGSGGWKAGGARALALNPFAARIDLLRYLAYGLAFWIAATVGRPRTLLHGLVGLGGGVAAFAIVQYGTWNGLIYWTFASYEAGPRPELGRTTGPFVNPDHLATFLVLTAPLAAGLLTVRSRRRRRDVDGSGEALLRAVVIGLALVLMLAALVGTASRGGIVAVALGFVWLWWRVSTDKRRERRRRPRGRFTRMIEPIERWVPVAAVVLAIGGGLLFAGETARETLDLRLAEAVGERWDNRLDMWWQALPMLRDFPLVGVGIGSWEDVFPLYQRPPLVGLWHTHAHNEYLEWACETGLVGLAIVLALLVAIARWARRNDSIPRRLRWGIEAGIAAGAVAAFFDFGLRMPGNAMVLAVMLGLLGNRRWRGEPLAEEPRPVGHRLGAIAVAVVVVVASAGLFREFLAWRSVREGKIAYGFAPRNAETWQMTGSLFLGAGYRYEPPTAACFREASLRRPLYSYALHGLSIVSTTFETKARALETALDLRPMETPWRLEHARVLDVLGRGDEALRQVETAVRLDPRPGAHRYARRGEELPESLREAVARGALGAVDDRPRDPAVIHWAATLLDRVGRHEEALMAWQRGAELTGDWAFYGLRAGRSAVRAGDLDRAEDLFRRTLAVAPSEARVWFSLARDVLSARGEGSEAETTLLEGVSRVPRVDRSLLYRELARIRRERKDSEGEVAALAKAVELDPRSARLQSDLGRAHLRLRAYHRARLAFGKAIALAPGEWSYHYYKGIAAERLYDFRDARDSFQEAVRLAPGNGTAEKALERVEKAFRTVKSGSPPADA